MIIKHLILEDSGQHLCLTCWMYPWLSTLCKIRGERIVDYLKYQKERWQNINYANTIEALNETERMNNERKFEKFSKNHFPFETQARSNECHMNSFEKNLHPSWIRTFDRNLVMYFHFQCHLNNVHMTLCL